MTAAETLDERAARCWPVESSCEPLPEISSANRPVRLKRLWRIFAPARRGASKSIASAEVLSLE